MGIAKPGDPQIPDTDLPLTDEEATVATLEDPFEPTDTGIEGEVYDGEVEDYDDESVATDLDDGDDGEGEDL